MDTYSSSGGLRDVATITILSGQSLSAPIDLGSGRLGAIQVSSGWDAANLTFQVSSDGIVYSDLYDDTGTEVKWIAAASRLIVPANFVQWCAIRYIKVRSGTFVAPVTQTADRSLLVSSFVLI